MKKIYNITFSVDTTVENAWVEAVKNDFLPSLLSCEMVCGVDFIQVNTPEDISAQESSTYTVQVRFDSEEMLNSFLMKKETEVEKGLKERFGEKYLTFRLVLNSIYSHRK